jgi:uncharacterized membrane protein YkoI
LALERRTLLALLVGAALSLPLSPALAKDGDGEGHGGDDGGGDDGGSDNDSDNGGDDGGGDDGGDGHDDGRSKKREDDGWSQDKVLRERELGRVITLQAALRIVAAKVHGRVIDVDLLVRSGKPQYRVKVRRADGVIQTVRLDARTGRILGFLGF